MSNAEKFAAAANAPAFFSKESAPGAKLNGRITALAFRQTRDVKTNKPEFWDDGGIKEQLAITVDNLDFGSKGAPELESYTIYVKWWGANKKAFAQAVKDAHMAEPLPGDVLTVSYIGEGPQPENKSLNPEKLYAYELGQAPQNREQQSRAPNLCK